MTSYGLEAIPPLEEVLATAVVVSLPMRVRFRGITEREVVLVEGPAGWGEFGPFPEYDDAEAAEWLRSALESAWLDDPEPLRSDVPVNATVPAVDPDQVAGILARFPGAHTAKVKVAERGQDLAQDVARVRAVHALVPHVRVDANGGWSVDDAVTALTALAAEAPLEYAEQPCATVPELVEVRRRLQDDIPGGIRIAADESIRRAGDPMRVVRAGGADVAIVKVAPLGGVRRLLTLAGELADHDVPVVVSSALDSAVGMGAGLAAAAALPDLPFACGLGTGGFFTADVATPRSMSNGTLTVGRVAPSRSGIDAVRVDAERERWWLDRVRRCHSLLG
ncbi:o-succinylbenzoate synthase [Rhodococcus artemisiae]|uniref:o-succinylbenzoate synthase n=2 Tax=Rhodococcus artemisiae TaxID=714159 RepID=A0ABU7LCZ4_9NOCA|nr:o-succinylbenzoate synthase [Rhodococcus artemisiae]MEE2059416.1 o-succinylbenzoate synthase [Rhodococcus artemisiae]